MSSIIRYLSVLIVAVLAAAPSRADVIGIGPRGVRADSMYPRNAIPFVLEADENAKEVRLIVPKSLARNVDPRYTVVTPAAPRHADGGAILFPVGGALALAYAGAGFCLLSGRAVSRRLLLLLALVGAGGGAAWATPPVKQPLQRVEYPNGLPLDGVAVEFVDKGDSVRLIVPKARVAELAVRLHAKVAR